MKLSTQTILILGLIQCIVLTLILVLFFRYQRAHQPDILFPAPETAAETQK